LQTRHGRPAVQREWSGEACQDLARQEQLQADAELGAPDPQPFGAVLPLAAETELCLGGGRPPPGGDVRELGAAAVAHGALPGVRAAARAPQLERQNPDDANADRAGIRGLGGGRGRRRRE